MMNADNISSILAYLFDISPIIFTHLVIPPLTHFRGEQPPQNLALPFDAIRLIGDNFDEAFITSLTLNPIKDKDRIFPWISHLVVHVDYEHLLSNLRAIVEFGYPIHQELGIFCVYCLFIGGGVISALPSRLYLIQNNSFVKSIRESFLFEGIRNPLNPDKKGFSIKLGDLPDRVVSVVASFRPQRFCGSSGGVCAMLGCQGILLLRDVYHNIRIAYCRYTSTKSSHSSSGDSNRRKIPTISFDWTSPSVASAVVGCFRCFRIFQYLGSELVSVYGLNGGGGNNNSLTAAFRVSVINHVAHVQGALFGVAFGLVFGVVVPYAQRRRIVTRL